MEEHISIVITILSSLLTGGFLMILFENQHILNNVLERFRFIANPFFHSFSNYAKFISMFNSSFDFNNVQPRTYMENLSHHLNDIDRYGGMCIMSGRDFPSDYFNAKQLNDISEKINDIWYCIDRDPEGFREVDYDEHSASLFQNQILGYLSEISPKYKNLELSKDLLSKVSGEFYSEIYSPIMDIFPKYEEWEKKEAHLKKLEIRSVYITIISMILILLFSDFIPMYILNLFPIFCSAFLLYVLYKLLNLEYESKEIFK